MKKCVMCYLSKSSHLKNQILSFINNLSTRSESILKLRRRRVSSSYVETSLTLSGLVVEGPRAARGSSLAVLPRHVCRKSVPAASATGCRRRDLSSMTLDPRRHRRRIQRRSPTRRSLPRASIPSAPSYYARVTRATSDATRTH